MIIGAIVAAILLLAAIAAPVYFFVIKPNGNSTSGSSSSTKGDSTTGGATGTATASATPTPSATPVTGGDGSIVTLEDGTTFVYKNPHGGFWYWDENDPFNNGARPQSWSPGLNETFRYGTDLIRGSVSFFDIVRIIKLTIPKRQYWWVAEHRTGECPISTRVAVNGSFCLVHVS